jgi:hypothetical protein
VALSGLKRANPTFLNGSAAVLTSLRNLTMSREHRIGRSRVTHVTLADALTEQVIAIFKAKSLELVMQVENHSRTLKATRLTTCVWMEADDEESLATKADGKVGVIWQRLNPLVIRQPERCIFIRERLKACPKVVFEFSLRQGRWALEYHNEAAELRPVASVPAYKGEEGRIDAEVVPTQCEIARDDECELIAR